MIKANCKNCTAFEENEGWCDFWSTNIHDPDNAFCSKFVICDQVKEEIYERLNKQTGGN